MAQTHLFVDTNVFLDFYSYAKDDLGQLTRLTEHLGPDEIRLHLPQQVINEVERNRETKLKTSAEQFKKESFPTAIPRHMQDFAHAKDYTAAVDAAFKARTAMINQAAAEASNKTLAADKALELLIAKAIVYEDDNAVFTTAIQRMQKGNPPGKSGSLGDQYNWECLLANVPEADLHVVSKDGDYASSLNPGKPHPFLEKEWKARKSADLHFYSSIRPFLDKILPMDDPAEALEVEPPAEVHPAAELELNLEGVAAAAQAGNISAGSASVSGVFAPVTDEKKSAIEDLVGSVSFWMTHNAIAKLQEIRSILTDSDAEMLIESAISNPQISRIADDSDVFFFLHGAAFRTSNDQSGAI